MSQSQLQFSHFPRKTLLICSPTSPAVMIHAHKRPSSLSLCIHCCYVKEHRRGNSVCWVFSFFLFGLVLCKPWTQSGCCWSTEPVDQQVGWQILKPAAPLAQTAIFSGITQILLSSPILLASPHLQMRKAPGTWDATVWLADELFALTSDWTLRLTKRSVSASNRGEC